MSDFAGTPRYRVLRRIGEGGMGVVYEALDRQRGCPVALKTLLKANPTAIYRFKQEFRVLADVSHPNVVTLHELVNYEAHWFFTMELITGTPFLSWCRERDAGAAEPTTDSMPTIAEEAMPTIATEMMPTIASDDGILPSLPDVLPVTPIRTLSATGLRRLRTALEGLAQGLVVLHEAGKLHRDVKPSNVLVTQTGRVVLVDFGLIADQDATATAGNAKGLDAGTVAYMPPEHGPRTRPTAAGDWYAVGTMLYQALTGRLPFAGSVRDVIQERRKQPPPSPDVLVADLPEDLVALCKDLLAIRPQDRPQGRQVLVRLGARTPPRSLTAQPWRSRTASTPFVGRLTELEALAAALDRIERGTATVVHVFGPQGVGKSALFRQFLSTTNAQERAWVFGGRCFEHEIVPFKAVDSIIDALSEQLSRFSPREVAVVLPPGIAALASLFPVLNRVDAIRARSARGARQADGPDVRQRAYAAFRSLLFALGRSRPVVILIDDLQWGDPDTAALFATALGPPEPPPVLLVVAYPTPVDPDHPLIQTLRAPQDGAFDVVAVPLEPFDRADAEALAFGLLSAPPTEAPDTDTEALAHAWPMISIAEREDLARAIAEESAGVPLFIHELAHHARRERSHVPETDEIVLTIDEVVRTKAAELNAASNSLLRVLAIADRPLSITVANRAAGLSPRHRAATNALLRAKLAKRQGSQNLEPYHRRVGVAIRAALSADERRKAHASLAAALAEDGDRDATLLITHLAEAGRSDRAAQTAREAALRSRDQITTDLLSRAAVRPATAQERFAEAKTQAKELEEAGQPEAAEAYLAAAKLTRQPGKKREMRRRAAEQLLRFGVMAQGYRLLDTILREERMPIPNSPRRLWARLAVERRALAERGLEWSEAAPDALDPDQVRRADACWSAAVGLAMVDVLTAGLYSTRYLMHALDLGDPNRIARALAMEIVVNSADGPDRTARTRAVLETLRAVARRIDAPYVRGFGALGAAMAALYEGRWAESAQCCRNAERVLHEQCTGVDWEVTTTQAVHVWALAYQGHFTDLRATLETHVGHATARRNGHGTVLLRISSIANLVWLADDDVETALSNLEEGQRDVWKEGFRLPHFWLLASAIQADLYRGEGLKAYRRASQKWPALIRSGCTRIRWLRVEALYARARSALAAVREAPTQRPLLFQARSDAQALVSEETGWAKALGGLVEGRVLSCLGLGPEAQTRLEEAEETSRRAEMHAHAAVAAWRRAELVDDEKDRALALEAADARLRDLGVRNPKAFADLLAP